MPSAALTSARATRCGCFFLIIWLSWSTTGNAADQEFRLEFLSQPAETVQDFAVAKSAVSIRQPQSRQIPLSEFVSLRKTTIAEDWSQRTALVWLSNGDRLVGTPTAIDEETMTVRWLQFPASDPLKIPLEHVTAICLELPSSAEGRQKLMRMLATETERGDVAWLASGDRVAGEFTGLNAGEFVLSTPTGKLPILREKLLAMRFDPDLVAAVKPLSTRYLLTFSDGSRITAASFERNVERVSFTTAFGMEGSLPAGELTGFQVLSPVIQSLSERKPAAVRFTPYVGGEWPWEKDRNVLQGPLQLRGREFAIGLGVHSRTAISYAIEPKDREFRAIVGIDDAAEDGGHVIFSVAVDDRVVWTSLGITGTSEPLAIPPVNLRGGKRLTLTVEFGEQGDVRDYADWCDAIVLRTE
jgi:hypothetical protein